MRKITLMTAVLMGLGSVAAAKGHDQSGTLVPGSDVGSSTVTSAQGLGVAQSGGKAVGPQGSPGKSAQAGNSRR